MDFAASLYGSSTFAFVLRGDSITSARAYSAIAMQAIPVFISNPGQQLQLPFSHTLDWGSFSLHYEMNGYSVTDLKAVISRLRLMMKTQPERVRKLQTKLAEARQFFIYDYQPYLRSKSKARGKAVVQVAAKSAFYAIMGELQHYRTYAQSCNAQLGVPNYLPENMKSKSLAMEVTYDHPTNSSFLFPAVTTRTSAWREACQKLAVNPEDEESDIREVCYRPLALCKETAT
jgi:hypothetical protein